MILMKIYLEMGLYGVSLLATLRASLSQIKDNLCG